MDVACASTALRNACEVTAMTSRRPGKLPSKTHCTTIVDIRPRKRMQLNSDPAWKGANVSVPVAMRARTPEQQQACAEPLMTGPLHDAALTARNHFVHAAAVRTATGTVTCWELERARLITGQQDWN